VTDSLRLAIAKSSAATVFAVSALAAATDEFVFRYALTVEMQSVVRHVSFEFFTSAYLMHLKVEPPDFVVAPALEQGVPFFTAALAGAMLRVTETSSAAVDAARTLRNMEYLRR
jgi:hypothetical protein